MKPSRLQLTALALVLAGFRTLAAATADDGGSWRQLLEKEWLLEAQLRAESNHAARPATRDDAAGGCDGVTNGKWGFHTAEQENPWWQVDVGEVLPVAQVRIWNRSDTEGAAKRAARFEVGVARALQTRPLRRVATGFQAGRRYAIIPSVLVGSAREEFYEIA